MEKVQKIVLDISKENRHEYQPIFCPFTGVMLVSSDTLDDIDDFPESVVLVFTELIEEPYFIAPYFNDYYEKFINLEDTDEIIKTLNDKYGDGNYNPETGEFTPIEVQKEQKEQEADASNV